MKHSWKHPIVCNSCNGQFNYHKAEYFKSMMPVAIFAVVILILKYIGAGIDTEILIPALSLLLLSGASSFYLLRRVRLVEKT